MDGVLRTVRASRGCRFLRAGDCDRHVRRARLANRNATAVRRSPPLDVALLSVALLGRRHSPLRRAGNRDGYLRQTGAIRWRRGRVGWRRWPRSRYSTSHGAGSRIRQHLSVVGGKDRLDFGVDRDQRAPKIGGGVHGESADVPVNKRDIKHAGVIRLRIRPDAEHELFIRVEPAASKERHGRRRLRRS